MKRDDDHTAILEVKDITAEGGGGKVRANLIVISGNSAGKVFKLESEESIIGRGDDVDIQINDDGVSRHHARVVRSEEGIRIFDLGSTNGTLHNGRRIDSHLMEDGDKIQIGSTTILKFSYQDKIEESFQRQLYESATRDGLTRIYNKKFFLERLTHEFAYSVRHQLCLTLVIFDLDHFKEVNDTRGHQAGDYVLRRIAEMVQNIIRTEDIFARYGGEEFAIILRGADEDRGELFAQRLRRLVEGVELSFAGETFKITISLGVATLNHANFHDPNELIRAADVYLYRAKAGGRNRVESILTAQAR